MCVCVEMGKFVQAHCLRISYISIPRSVCAPVLVCVREDSPLRWLQFHTGQGGGEWRRTRDCKVKIQGELQLTNVCGLLPYELARYNSDANKIDFIFNQ